MEAMEEFRTGMRAMRMERKVGKEFFPFTRPARWGNRDIYSIRFQSEQLNSAKETHLPEGHSVGFLLCLRRLLEVTCRDHRKLLTLCPRSPDISAYS
jgi:hypothetical protein